MRNHEIEAWALQVIDDVLDGRPNEDSRVELKAEWLSDPWKAARQIAGHCNAARGEHVLWLIGIDQKQGIKGALHSELSNWFAQVDACFDSLAPRRVDLNIPTKDGKTVVALLFEADRVPFVVKNQKGGEISAEVPWRDATRIRSATRADLLQILSPIQRLPRLEVMNAMLQPVDLRVFSNVAWKASISLYVIPRDLSPVIIPTHKCEASYAFHNTGEPVPFKSMKFLISDSDSPNKATQSEAIIHNPGRLVITLDSAQNPASASIAHEATIELTLMPVDPEEPIVLPLELTPDSKDGIWTIGEPKRPRKYVSFSEMRERRRYP